MAKDDREYIEKALGEIAIVEEYSQGFSEYVLQNDRIRVDAIVLHLIQVAEHVDRLSDVFKSLHPDIEWTSIRGFRNRLVHSYGEVDLHFVLAAITKDIPALKDVFLKCINQSND